MYNHVRLIVSLFLFSHVSMSSGRPPFPGVSTAVDEKAVKPRFFKRNVEMPRRSSYVYHERLYELVSTEVPA